MYSLARLLSAVQNVIAALTLFGEISVPSDLNQRAENVIERCKKLLNFGEQWVSKINSTVASWVEVKENLGK